MDENINNEDIKPDITKNLCKEPQGTLWNNLENEDDVDPIYDIIDYLVRCAKISFKNGRVNEAKVKTSENTRLAYNLYKQSPTTFLLQFGRYLTSNHMNYFENLPIPDNVDGEKFKSCIQDLKIYHSDSVKNKRIRNRRFKACQKLKEKSDYFSEKEMMYRNPLLYEQLIGQYLTEDEIMDRDGADSENLTLLNMILETVDRNQMRETKNIQMISEGSLEDTLTQSVSQIQTDSVSASRARWGEFETVDREPSSKPEQRKQAYINAPEQRLLREEFYQEMYNSFIDGRDVHIDYNSIDNDEQYDDLNQVSQDAEDKYFDSEPIQVENLEQHMKLVDVYGKEKNTDECDIDTLDEFMTHLNKRSINL